MIAARRSRLRRPLGGRGGIGLSGPTCGPSPSTIEPTSPFAAIVARHCIVAPVGAIEGHASPAGTEPEPSPTIAPDPFEAAARGLDAADVRWCRLRDRDGGQEDDILVNRADLSTARTALGHAGWREHRHLGHGTHRSFYTFDPEGDRWLKIDTVTALDFGRWQEWRPQLAAGCLAGQACAPLP